MKFSDSSAEAGANNVLFTRIYSAAAGAVCILITQFLVNNQFRAPAAMDSKM